MYYDTAVYPLAINIYQTYNPGAIIQVSVIPAGESEAMTVFSGSDLTTSCPGVLGIAVLGKADETEVEVPAVGEVSNPAKPK